MNYACKGNIDEEYDLIFTTSYSLQDGKPLMCLNPDLVIIFGATALFIKIWINLPTIIWKLFYSEPQGRQLNKSNRLCFGYSLGFINLNLHLLLITILTFMLMFYREKFNADNSAISNCILLIAATTTIAESYFNNVRVVQLGQRIIPRRVRMAIGNDNTASAAELGTISSDQILVVLFKGARLLIFFVFAFSFVLLFIPTIYVDRVTRTALFFFALFELISQGILIRQNARITGYVRATMDDVQKIVAKDTKQRNEIDSLMKRLTRNGYFWMALTFCCVPLFAVVIFDVVRLQVSYVYGMIALTILTDVPLYFLYAGRIKLAMKEKLKGMSTKSSARVTSPSSLNLSPKNILVVTNNNNALPEAQQP